MSSKKNCDPAIEENRNLRDKSEKLERELYELHRRFAHAWLLGYVVTDERGHHSHRYFKPRQKTAGESQARRALAHLVLHNALDAQLRHYLAMLIDPTVFSSNNHPPTLPGYWKPPKYHSRFEIVRGPGSRHGYVKINQVAAFVAERIDGKRGSIDRAQWMAVEEFGLAKKTVEEYWSLHAKEWKAIPFRGSNDDPDQPSGIPIKRTDQGGSRKKPQPPRRARERGRH